jgi:hypothetical protein
MTMGKMKDLWADPTFLDSIQNDQASADSAAPAPAPGSLHMRTDGDDKPKTPNLRPSDEDLKKIADKEPRKCVPRAEVEEALKKFLGELAVAQKSKHNAVKSTDKVWQADVALHQNLENDVNGPITPKGGDGKEYDAGELASTIAGQLPDTIPIENYNRFLKLKPTDTVLPGSTTDQIRKKYEEARDGIVAKISKKFGDKIGGLAKKAMDAAVEKGVSYVADKALEDAGVNSDEMKKAVDDYIKKVTGDKDGE